jgi:DNA-binding NarL/FixJ family response regulator
MIRIVLADDHRVVREALRLLLETQPDFEVLAETGDGQEVVQLVKTHKPDVLVVDLKMPGLTGLHVARAVQDLSVRPRVIVLSMHDAESFVVEALQAGVSGYVLKKGSSSELIFAIRHALEGQTYLSPALNARALEAYLERAEHSREDDPFTSLTRRERDVFHLAIDGMSNPQIAKALSISPRTAEMHRSNLLRKLGMKSQTELVKFAVARGLTE